MMGWVQAWTVLAMCPCCVCMYVTSNVFILGMGAKSTINKFNSGQTLCWQLLCSSAVIGRCLC